MPEPNFPDAPLTHLSFDLRERTPADPASEHAQVAQCNFQHQGGELQSFDVEQLPKFLTALMGELVLTQATTLTNQATIIASHAAEIEAKDANNALLVERVAELEADKARLLLKLAETDSSLASPAIAAEGAPAT